MKRLLRGDAESGHEPQDRELELREVFQVTALHELERLGTQTGWLRHADDRSLTRTAIQLSKQCVKVRLDYTRKALNSSHAAAQLTRDELRNRAKNAGLRNGGWRRPTWADHYNAASLYALGITCGAPRTEHEKLADAAVEQLRRAVAAADSAYVASRRAWLVSEDPDLEGLRPQPAFKRFETTCLPAAEPAMTRPPEAHRWERSQYVHGLLVWCAEHRQELWRARADRPAGDGDQPHSEWWSEEGQAWRLVGEVAMHCEHSPTRLKLLDALTVWSRRHGWPDGPLQYPDYANVALCDGDVAGALNAARGRLAHAAALAHNQVSGCAQCWDESQRRPPDRFSAQSCQARASAWQWLRDRLDPVESETDPSAVHDARDRSRPSYARAL